MQYRNHREFWKSLNEETRGYFKYKVTTSEGVKVGTPSAHTNYPKGQLSDYLTLSKITMDTSSEDVIDVSFNNSSIVYGKALYNLGFRFPLDPTAADLLEEKRTVID